MDIESVSSSVFLLQLFSVVVTSCVDPSPIIKSSSDVQGPRLLFSFSDDSELSGVYYYLGLLILVLQGGGGLCN